MTDIEVARAALRLHVERVVPEGDRPELSRLTAAFVASIVREERAKAKRQIATATELFRQVSSLRSRMGMG